MQLQDQADNLVDAVTNLNDESEIDLVRTMAVESMSSQRNVPRGNSGVDGRDISNDRQQRQQQQRQQQQQQQTQQQQRQRVANVDENVAAETPAPPSGPKPPAGTPGGNARRMLANARGSGVGKVIDEPRLI
jgi:transcription initiation factor TFIID subunit TAF12